MKEELNLVRKKERKTPKTIRCSNFDNIVKQLEGSSNKTSEASKVVMFEGDGVERN